MNLTYTRANFRYSTYSDIMTADRVTVDGVIIKDRDPDGNLPLSQAWACYLRDLPEGQPPLRFDEWQQMDKKRN